MNRHDIARAGLWLKGWMWKTRHTTSSLVSHFSIVVHMAILDVAVVIHPVKAGGGIGPRRAWLGLAVIVLLAVGLVVSGQAAFGLAAGLVPHRVERP